MMFPTKELPSPSSIFSAYASITASLMLVRTMANDLIPHPIRGYLLSTIQSLFKTHPSRLTLVIEEFNGIIKNQVYEASETYLCSKVSGNTERLRISKSPKEKNLTIHLEHGEKITDSYEGVELKWNFVSVETERNDRRDQDDAFRSAEKRRFEVRFDKKHKELVLNSYLPYVLERAKIIRDDQRVLKIFTLANGRLYGGTSWDSANLEHPATFETLAMDPEMKNAIIEDLNRFVGRKDFYKRVGRAWKRGYLLYGPPGTGKSSLVAAMANHLKFNVYDLQLNNIMTDSDLRRLLLTTGNRSILVIEDIDCTIDFSRERVKRGDNCKKPDVLLTLSGLLNFIDGLWSSCGDERIIIFTTNNKEKLDPALLRPGRMDVHIHLSYCTFQGFKILASNYLDSNHLHRHRLYGEIEAMIEAAEVTPAQVAEELMKSEDADVALEGVVRLLKRKKVEGEDDVDADKSGVQDKKRAKLDNGHVLGGIDEIKPLLDVVN